MHRSPEFNFVVLCARSPSSPQQAASLRNLTGQPLQWQRVLAIAIRQGVAAQVYRACQSAAIAIPAAASEAFAQAARVSAAYAFELTWESGRLQAAMLAAGIQPAFLKGPSLSMLAYGDLGLRHAKDIDILVPPNALARASEILRDAGYQPRLTPAQLPDERAAAKSIEWLHPTRNIEVELHWRPTDLSFPQASAWLMQALARTEPVPITEHLSLHTFAPNDLLLYLCIHGASHAWSRLKWLADVNALLSPRTAGQIHSLHELSRSLGIDRPVGQALLLCERFFHLPVPPEIRTQLARDPALRLATAIAAATLQRAGGAREIYDLPFGTTLVYVSRLFLGHGFTFVSSELRHALLPPEHAGASPGRPRFPIAARLFHWLRQRLRHRGRSRPPQP